MRPGNAEVFPERVTIGAKYGPAMKITTQESADAYFEHCVDHTMLVCGVDRPEAERIERINLAYYAGYYDVETSERVCRLYHCQPPVFADMTGKSRK